MSVMNSFDLIGADGPAGRQIRQALAMVYGIIPEHHGMAATALQ
jgi:hypothetical protein